MTVHVLLIGGLVNLMRVGTKTVGEWRACPTTDYNQCEAGIHIPQCRIGLTLICW